VLRLYYTSKFVLETTGVCSVGRRCWFWNCLCFCLRRPQFTQTSSSVYCPTGLCFQARMESSFTYHLRDPTSPLTPSMLRRLLLQRSQCCNNLLLQHILEVFDKMSSWIMESNSTYNFLPTSPRSTLQPLTHIKDTTLQPLLLQRSQCCNKWLLQRPLDVFDKV
jgi:hypothetical protein